jgi:hypothetical protein
VLQAVNEHWESPADLTDRYIDDYDRDCDINRALLYTEEEDDFICHILVNFMLHTELGKKKVNTAYKAITQIYKTKACMPLWYVLAELAYN